MIIIWNTRWITHPQEEAPILEKQKEIDWCQLGKEWLEKWTGNTQKANQAIQDCQEKLFKKLFGE